MLNVRPLHKKATRFVARRRAILALTIVLPIWLALTFGGLTDPRSVEGREGREGRNRENGERVREMVRRRARELREALGARTGRKASPGGPGPERVAPPDSLDFPVPLLRPGGPGGPGVKNEPGLERTLLGRARARYDQPREAIQHFLFKRLPEGERDLEVSRYVTAREQAESMPHYSTVFQREVEPGDRLNPNLFNTIQSGEQATALGVWSPLGPGNIGGRTRALLINPTKPEIMYAAGVSGGVWKSVDAGASWVPLTDLLPGITVSSMAFDPTNPETILVGTGEGVAVFERDTQGDFRGAGIFKTTDGGATWARLASTATPDFYFVNDIVISRGDAKRIYAATRTGVWRSLDGGATWTQSLNPVNSNGRTVQGGCLDLADRAAESADIIFAACGTFERSIVYRNTNAAAAGTWTAVLSEVGMGRTALAISPSNPSTIYAVSTSIENGPFAMGLHAVHRSVADGEPGSWVARVRNTSSNPVNQSLLSTPPLSLSTYCGYGDSNDFSGQGWYDLTIAVDPLDPNRVWVGGIDIFRSDDGGVNWGLAGPTYVGPTFESGPIHPDFHVLVFHPQYNGTTNQQLLVGNDGGVYRTLNARAAVAVLPEAICRVDGIGVRWQSLNTNYGVTQFYHGSVSPDGESYFGGTQDNGTIIGTDQGGINKWSEILGGDGGYTAFDLFDPRTLYASFTNISFMKSTDGGRTFGEATQGIDDNGLFITPFAMDPSDPQRLWTGGDFIWRTTSGGANWERASTFTSGTQQVSAIAVSPVDSNRVLVGMADGFIHWQNAALGTNQESIWPSNRPRTGYVSSLAFDPVAPEIAYATYSTFSGKHVWRTIDGGITWNSIDGTGTGALPDIPIHALVVDPSNTARLYVGTDLGVFVTNNGGTTWAVEYSGFANVITEALQININNGVTSLYAFTHGRGVWRVRVSNTGCRYQLSPATLTVEKGSGTIDVIAVPGTPEGCTWEASTRPGGPNWLGATGRGTTSGKATWSAAENTTFEDRIGTVTIAGRALTVIQPARKDLESPLITVTEATTPRGEINTAGMISLSGTITENDRVVSITWSTDRGASGDGEQLGNGTAWRAFNIPLGPGVNQITVTALDRAGNVGLTTWNVTSRPPSVLLTVAGTGENGYSGDGGQAVAAKLSRPMRLAFDPAGALYFADADNNVVRRLNPDGTINTVVGTGEPGFSGDGGPARQAALSFPLSVAVDKSGNLYICDNVNARIRKVNLATGVITTIAGTGSTRSTGDGGPALDAGLSNPQSIDLDADGNVYIVESGSHRVRRITVADGKIQTIVGTGTAGSSGDGGPANQAQLTSPNNISIAPNGNLLISDGANNRIRLVTVNDGRIQTIAGTGQAGFSGDGGPAVNAALNWPTSAIYDALGNIFIADRGNQRIRRIDAASKTITTIAGRGQLGYGGDGVSAIFSPLNGPTSLAIDPAGSIYLSDRDNRRIRKIVNSTNDAVPPVIGITSPTVLQNWRVDAGVIDLAGVATDNNQLVAIRWANDRGGAGAVIGTTNWKVEAIPLQQGLNRLSIVAWDNSGNSTTARLNVQMEVESIIRTVAGSGQQGRRGDGGLAVSADLYLPSAVAIDKAGNIYVADSGNHRLRRIAPNGQITPFAGTGSLGSTGDGGPAINATLNSPSALAFDSKGNLFVADAGNHRIRRISTDGIITTVAGNGDDQMAGDGGPATAASLYLPYGLAIDGSDNLLIADTGNLRIRKVDLRTGLITTIAGSGRYGSEGDGQSALQASFRAPYGVTVDPLGSIYVVDGDDNRVRRIDQNGNIAPFAGTGSPGSGGDGGPATEAQLKYPSFVTTDRDGNLYIADYGNHRIRRVSVVDGRITTVVGSGSPGSGLDDVSPLTTTLLNPNDVAIDPTGRLVIADTGNHKIRQTTSTAAFKRLVTTSSASYSDQLMARESLVSIFGQSLATETLVASSLPLPTELGGTTVRVRDAAGIERTAQLFFVSPGQINFLVPASTSPGTASVTVMTREGRLSTGLMPISNTAPAIFTAAADGRGIAAAYALRLTADGRQLVEQVVRYDASSATWLPVPIDLGPAGDQVFLVLFGTGWRFIPAAASLSVLINGAPVAPVYAGPQGGFVGLDQLNLRLDRTLAGRGLVDLQLAIDGTTSNVVKIHIR